MIAEALDIARETYFAILLDRMYDGPVKRKLLFSKFKTKDFYLNSFS